jgi:hypothetical protein
MMTLDESTGVAAGDRADDARAVVVLARQAPSVHNTQPWRWRVDGQVLELRADRARQLARSDPSGRNLMISCGAALHHAVVAAAGLGRSMSVTRFPDPEEPDLLARIRLGDDIAVTPQATRLMDAISSRRTDRRRFTSWPVPGERLDGLAEAARGCRARVIPLIDADRRSIVERLADRAIEVMSKDRALLAEQKAWIARADDEGIPVAALPPRHSSQRRDRFHLERAVTGEGDGAGVTASDQVLAICTARDDAESWLDTGETLSALWLHATLLGLSLVPLSQVIEVAETRAALREEILAGLAHPQMLVRIGWLQLTRRGLVPTPRRRVADVVDGLPGPG